jgi:DNA-directed RNA polymerase subunit RPC12/RpoP
MKRFTHIDEEFVCVVCGADVPALGYTARNHCKNCLYSLHLDVNPGDRQSECGGILSPVGIEQAQKGLKILYKCDKCGEIRRNIVADDDSYTAVLELATRKAYKV